jgi:hypothetical protein
MLAPLRSRFTRVAERFTGGAQRTGEPPLVRPPVPFLGHALAMGRDLTELLRACQREHGDVFTLLVAGRRMHFIVDPFSFPQVLKAQDNLTFHEIGDEIGQTRVRLHAAAPGGRPATRMQAAYSDHLKNAALGPLTERMEERLRRGVRAVHRRRLARGRAVRVHVPLHVPAGLETLFGVGVGRRPGAGRLSPAWTGGSRCWPRGCRRRRCPGCCGRVSA